MLRHQLGPRDHTDNALCQAQVSVLGGNQQESQHVGSDFQQSAQELVVPEGHG